jgi:hypothetical protein
MLPPYNRSPGIGPMRRPSSLGKRFDHQIAKAMAFMPANIPNTSVHPNFPSINNFKRPEAPGGSGCMRTNQKGHFEKSGGRFRAISRNRLG